MIADWLLPACTLFVFSVLIAILALLVQQAQTKKSFSHSSQLRLRYDGHESAPDRTAAAGPAAGADQGSAANLGHPPAAEDPDDQAVLCGV